MSKTIDLGAFLEKRDRIRAEFERCEQQGLLPPSWSDLGRISREVMKRRQFLTGAAAVIAAPFLAVLPLRRAPNNGSGMSESDFELWVAGVIAPGHTGTIELAPGKFELVHNRTSEPISREPWVNAAT